MKPINAHTKIAHLIKAHPEALEAIISIDQKFDKLRNPLLRKLFAGRTSIAMASKISGCQVDEFYKALKPLGFEIDSDKEMVTEKKKALPAFITNLKSTQIVDFDVRNLLTSGKDPLSFILDRIKTLQSGQALKIINMFEPVPLIKMLEKQGFQVYVDAIEKELVETYFYKKDHKTTVEAKAKEGANSGWDEIIQRFTNNLVTVDVRELEMPLPMHTILGELDELPTDKALFVYHKRIPVFLLPELSDRDFDYRIQEVEEGQVRLLIFKN